MAQVEDMVDQSILNAVNIERYKLAHIKEIMPILNKLSADIEILILRMDSSSPREVQRTIKRINELIDIAYKKVKAKMEQDYIELVKASIEQEEDILALYFGGKEDMSLTKEERDSLIAPILASFTMGKKLSKHISELIADAKSSVGARIRRGITDGENITAIARGLRGTRGRRFKDGVFNKFLNNMDAVARTTITSITNKAKISYYKKIGLDKYRWISVLDSRTTAICRGRSNKIYLVSAGPVPPAHYRCRSTIIPYRRGDTLPASYGEWLRKQPRSVVEDVLGKTKASLFLNNKLTLDKFVSPQGRELTIKELRKKIKGGK